MNAKEFVESTLSNPEYQELTMEQKIGVRTELLGALKQGDEEYRRAPLDTKHQFDKLFMTSLGFDANAIEGDDNESNAVREMLLDVDNVRNGGEASLNGWDGIAEGGRNFLTGKVGFGIVDLFTEGSTVDAFFGDERKEAERYRDYVYGTYKPEGLTDYKIGKVAGNVIGFAGDAYVTSQLYGSVGSAGLLTRPLTGVTSRLMDWSLKVTGGKTKLLGTAIAAIGQGSFEASAFVGEEWIANKVIGALETDEQIQGFVNDIPSKFLQGLAYFTIGESIGAGAGAFMKNMGTVFSKNGYRGTNFKKAWAQVEEIQIKATKTILEGGDDAAIEASLRAMESAGVDKKIIQTFYDNMLEVKSWQNPDLLLSDPVKLQQKMLKLLHNMDTEIVGDAIKVNSYGVKTFDKPMIFNDDASLQKFLQEQARLQENDVFKLASLVASDRKGKVTLSIKSNKGVKLEPVETSEILEKYRPKNGVVDEKYFEEMAEKVLGKKVKMVPVDDYTASYRSMLDDGIYIPKSVNSKKESEKFVNDFFKQLENLAEDGTKFNIKGIRRALKDTSSIDYKDLTFLRKLSKGFDIQTEEIIKGVSKNTKVTISKNGQFIESFDSIEEAARTFHMRNFSEPDLAKSIKRRTGYKMEKGEDHIRMISDDGGVAKTFNTLEEIYDDPNYRPNIPFEQRPVYLALNTETSNVKTFKTGKIQDVVKELEKYEALPGATIDRLNDGINKMTFDPKWTTFEVTLGDSKITKEFKDLKEAKEWMSKGLDTFNDVEKYAKEMGQRVEPTNVGYMVYSADVEPRFAQNLDGVKNIIKERGDIRKMKDIFDDVFEGDEIDALKNTYDEMYDEVSDIVTKGKFKQKKYHRKRKGFLGTTEEQFEKFFVPIRERFELLGDARAVNVFDQVSTMNKLFHKEYAGIKVQLQGIFHGTGDKYSTQQLENMGRIILETTDEKGWVSYASKHGLDLDDEMLKTMGSVRSLMDSAGIRFNIDRSTWEGNYISRIRNKTPKELSLMLGGDALVAETGGKVTLDDEWFRYTRSEDIVAGMFESNIEIVTDMYMRYGLRKQYLGGVMDEVDKFMKLKDVDPRTHQLMQEAAQKVNGQVYTRDKASAVLNRLRRTQALAKQIMDGEGKYAKLSDADRIKRATDIRHRDYNQFANSMVTAALMSFKMKMPVRNVSQVFTTLGVISEGEYMTAALKKLESKEAQERLYKEYLNKGIIKPRDVDSAYGPLGQRIVNKINRYGMAQFYNSDDFTRMVAATTAGEHFKDGLALLTAQKLNPKQFADYMNIDLLHEADQAKFLRFIMNKKYTTAETFLQRRWTDITMFDYDLLNKPEGLTTGIGKIFGQYSTYPSSYLQLMRRGVTRGGKRKAVGFAARATLASATVAAFYNDVLNIDGLPIAPPSVSMFGGGPMINLGASTLTTIGSNQAVDDKAKRISKEVTRTMLPLYGISNSLIKSMEHLKEAEFRDGLTRAIGGSPPDESYIENVADMF